MLSPNSTYQRRTDLTGFEPEQYNFLKTQDNVNEGVSFRKNAKGVIFLSISHVTSDNKSAYLHLVSPEGIRDCTGRVGRTVSCRDSSEADCQVLDSALAELANSFHSTAKAAKCLAAAELMAKHISEGHDTWRDSKGLEAGVERIYKKATREYLGTRQVSGDWNQLESMKHDCALLKEMKENLDLTKYRPTAKGRTTE